MASFQKRVSENGEVVYRARVRLKGHPTRTATFPRLSEARKWATATEAAIREGRYFPSSPVGLTRHTVAELLNRYHAEIMPHKRASTIQSEQYRLYWWRKRLGSLAIGDITPAIVAEHRDKLLRGRSGSTVNRYLAVLSHVFTVAIKEWGWASDNPCLKVTKPREGRPRVRYLSDEERHRLLSACKESRSPVLYLVVVLALSTGARRGELLGLCWRDVDLDRESIILHETKNGDRRALPLTGHALTLMQEHAQAGGPAGFVFPGPCGKKPLRMHDAWPEAVKRAGLEDFRFHDLRHTAASYMAMGGASLAEIAEVLGHRSLEVTRRYAHLSQDHTRAVVARMNQTMFGSGQD